MSVTADTVVVGVDPDMTRDAWVASLAGTPAESTASEAYDRIVARRVSHAFCRSVFRHESSDGTAGICPLYVTRSPGNTRSTRNGLGLEVNTNIEQTVNGVVIPPARKGVYMRYARWPDGWDDLAWRLVDPAYVYVREGRQTIRQIITRFAPASDNNDPGAYVNAVVTMMQRWTGAAPVPPQQAQIPGFAWKSADARHHTKGRTKKISGFACHYTGGTNSLDWLTVSPNSDVSATFLIKHTPTLEDRGWQLVRIEDTAHTTGSVINPKTISFEYEQMEGQAIPGSAYAVMAQTIVDCRDYLVEHPDLGYYDLTRADIKGHKEWVGDNRVCPDGIVVDRVASEAQARDTTPAPAPGADPVTGKYIHQTFRSFYDERGGLDVFGRAQSGAFTEDGRLTQYFERSVFQHFPENAGTPYEVLLRLLGTEELERRYPGGTAPA